MMGKLSTHILDQVHGKPAGGVRVQLFREDRLLASVTTNADGRTDAPLLSGDAFVAGRYRIDFFIGDYYSQLSALDAKRFLDVVPIVFIVDDPAKNYHVPLLVTPWSYSTYRGS